MGDTKPPLGILVADDDEGVREMLQYLLGDELGHHVFVAKNGQEALAVLAAADAGSLHLVITDYKMPGASGVEVARAAKRLGVKVILMSGDEPASIMRVAEAAGVDRFLFKPFRVEVMQQAITELSPESG